MNRETYKKAVEASIELLRLYSPSKPPVFAVTPSDDILQPTKLIREALAEAQYILNNTSQKALRNRMKFLGSSMKKQRVINMLHFVTASGFVVLIADIEPTLVKWLGSVVSLISGIVALTLPKNTSSLERETSTDVQELSALAGDIAKLESELILNSPENDPELAERIHTAISKCMRLSKKYELDSMARFFGFYPREKHPEEVSSDNSTR